MVYSAKLDSVKRDSAKQDSAKRDSAKRDSAKRDSAKWDRTSVTSIVKMVLVISHSQYHDSAPIHELFSIVYKFTDLPISYPCNKISKLWSMHKTF